jgi:hypothetical protein
MENMKRFYAALLAAAILTSACAEEPAEMSNPADAVAATDTADPAMLRPDALNPVNDNLTVPLGWRHRFDRNDAEITVGADADSFDVFFVSMTPGWHVTSNRASGIFWHPASTAEGSFAASTGIYLFPPGQMNEGYGLIFGARDLDTPDQSYFYFFVRRTGEFLIKRRMGESTETVQDWTAHEAIVPYTDETEGTTLNALGVHVDGETITFTVNETEVHSMPKGDLVTDGIVGLRLNHGLNVHVESFDVSEVMRPRPNE